MPKRDVIDRRYVQLKLSRDRRKYTNARDILANRLVEYIDDLKAWLKQSPKRTKRAGGIGR